ncbi:hypothetical protein ACF1GS_29805 [Streptomyces eurythermus]|uniref:hypothetical protein n=1 Tax=Streptomyces eurythermus TaxID=42237 RepID=UPI0036FF4268
MATKHSVVDGVPAPGPRFGTDTFDLIVRPADIDALPDDAPTRSSPAPAKSPASPTSC